jgi:hypothetical protein
MIRNFIIGFSLVALGVIVVGSLEAARTATSQFPITNGRSLIHGERTVRQIVWQRELALPQWGRAARQPARMPTVAPGN